MYKNIYIESLLSLGGKKKKNSIEFISNELLIRHKDSRIEYTVVKVVKEKQILLMENQTGRKVRNVM